MNAHMKSWVEGSEHGDFTIQNLPFGIFETAQSGRDTFASILQLQARSQHAILSLGRRAERANTLLQSLYRRPVITAIEAQTILNCSNPTAQALLRDLAQLGILEEQTGQIRDRSFVFETYLDLFLK